MITNFFQFLLEPYFLIPCLILMILGLLFGLFMGKARKFVLTLFGIFVLAVIITVLLNFFGVVHLW